jgi:hypothetical protein
MRPEIVEQATHQDAPEAAALHVGPYDDRELADDVVLGRRLRIKRTA